MREKEKEEKVQPRGENLIRTTQRPLNLQMSRPPRACPWERKFTSYSLRPQPRARFERGMCFALSSLWDRVFALA